MNGIDLKDSTLENENLTCGQDVTLTGEAWNIGDNDQRDVYVRFYNNELGIEKNVDIGDIDAFDNNNFDYTFTLPSNISEKWYDIKMSVYDRRNDIFENSENDKAIFDILFKVGNCHIVVPPTVSAKLSSEEAVAGKEMVVKITITNNNRDETLYSLNLDDYKDWATLRSIGGDVLRLNPGESANVNVTFNINKKVSGNKLFTLNIFSSDDKLVKSQQIGVSIKD